MNQAWAQVHHRGLTFFWGFAAIAWGLAFLKFIDQPYFYSGSCAAACTYTVTFTFPVFPNVLDVVGLFALGFFLLYQVVKGVKEETGKAAAGKLAKGAGGADVPVSRPPAAAPEVPPMEKGP